MFANGCFVGDAEHRFDDPDTPVTWQGFTSKGPVRIGSNCWFGVNCVVTSGVTIGERCVIGANSVVTRDLPRGDDRRRRAGPCDQGASSSAPEVPIIGRSAVTPRAWTTMNLALTDPSHARAGVKLVRAKAELRAALAAARREGRSIGLVPTMGCLHEGHLSLLRAARAECDVVVMSLFVNPTQFGPGEDLDRYPRDEERDAELAAEAGVDLVYAPPVEEVYPEGFSTAGRGRGR